MDSFNKKKSNTANKNKIKSALSFFVSFIAGAARKIFKNKLKIAGVNNDFDKKLVFSLLKTRIPNFKQLKYINQFLKSWEKLAIKICLLVIFASSIFIGVNFYKKHIQIIPTNGGKYIEGLIGSLQYINPLYASVNDVDNDISNLVFSSLFKRDAAGNLAGDLARDYKISADGKSYIITLKENVKWHDGSDLTVDDVIFTFNCIKDWQYHSPLDNRFAGVEITKINNTTVEFKLEEPYAAFLQLLDFGILPTAIWSQIPPNAANLTELNLKPIGSGPYKFKSFLKDKSGNIRLYSLEKNGAYYGQKPYLDELFFKFFPGFEEAIAALNEGEIDGISYLPRYLKDKIAVQDHINNYSLNIPQLTSLFLNTRNNVLKDKNVRQALALAINKEFIIKEILNNEGFIIDSPILPENVYYNSEIKKYALDADKAALLLETAGWKNIEISEELFKKAEADAVSEDESIKSEAQKIIKMEQGVWRKKNDDFLTFNLTTIDSYEYSEIAKAIQKFLRDINIKVEIELIPAEQMNNEVIKPRDFALLLHNIAIGSDPDPYAFWHSSQIAGGLNITNYSNKEADLLLEEARLTLNDNERKEKYKKFQEIIAEEVPAIFLYSPAYSYVQAKKIKGFNIINIITPRDRFNNISDWYIKTEKKIIW